jgi:protein gp37
MADVFDEEVCIEDFKDLLELIFKTQNLDWQLLTKRPENINKHLLDAFQSCFGGDTTDGHEYWDPFMEWLGSWSTFGNPPQNVWIGVSVENQEQADKRIPILLETPAAVRFLSCEPLLGPVSLSPQALGAGGRFGRNYQMPQIDWVIAGGESGHGARPMHPDWALSLRDQCKAARVPFLFKQWGEYYGESVNGTEVATDTLAPNEMVAWGDGNTYHIKYTRLGKTKSGRLLDGVEYNEFPKRST